MSARRFRCPLAKRPLSFLLYNAGSIDSEDPCSARLHRLNAGPHTLDRFELLAELWRIVPQLRCSLRRRYRHELFIRDRAFLWRGLLFQVSNEPFLAGVIFVPKANKRRGKLLTLRFTRKDRGIARNVFDLFHGDDRHFFHGVDFQHFHIVADGMADGIVDQQFPIVGKDNFYPIDHDGSLVNGIGKQVEK